MERQYSHEDILCQTSNWLNNVFNIYIIVYCQKMGNTLINCCGTEPRTPGQRQVLKTVKIIKKKEKKIGVGKGSISASVQSPELTQQDQLQQNRMRENCKSQNIKKFKKITLVRDQPKKLCLDDFQIEGLLGKGSFGAVYLAQLKSNLLQKITQKYAIKCVFKELLQRKQAFQQAKDQKIIGMSDCDFIVSLMMSFQDDYRLYYVMEYAAGGDTFGLINGNQNKVADFIILGQKAIKFIGGCVILGLEFIHNKNYIYRDLKPENIMIFQNGYVKLTDFGLATKQKTGECCKTITGTVLYEAPQMVLRKGYDRKYDLWCLGVYLYEMSNCCPPFQVDEIIVGKFEEVCLEAERKRIWVKPDISQELKDLIDGLLKFDPEERLGAKDFSQIKNHPFFHNFDWQALQNLKMPSPLKELVQKYPKQTFNESLLKYKLAKPKNQRPPKVEGWTYYGKYNSTM